MYRSAGILHGPERKLDSQAFGRYIFENLKSKHAQDVALIDAHTKESKTYGQILQESVRLACYFKENGICRNDVIAIVSENNLNYVAPVLAALYIGAIIQPLSAAWTYRELKQSFDISNPKWVFCSESALETVNKLRVEFKTIQLLILYGKQTSGNAKFYCELIEGKNVNLKNFEPEILDPIQQVAFIFNSSGTTGTPKSVMLTHQNIMQSMDYWRGDGKYGNYGKGDVTVVPMPFFHLFGTNMLLVCIIGSVKYILMNKFIPDLYLHCIEHYQANKISCPPSLIQFLAKSPLVDGYDLSSLEDIISGAAALKPEIQFLLKKRLNLSVRQAYGFTEIGGMCAIQQVGSSIPGSSGFLLPNVSVKVRHLETKLLLGCNQLGELCFKGPSLMKGYMNNPDATASAFDDDGFFLTGDVGYYDGNGLLFIVDRLKDLIKYKGFQVSPSELEGVLLLHPGVKDAAVIGISDEKSGELPLAYVVKEPGANVTEQSILDFVTDQVSLEKRLHGGVKFIDEIPKNPGGKILRRCLRELAADNL